MMKEIHEQPAAVRDTDLSAPEGREDRPGLSWRWTRKPSRTVRRLYIIGCGSAYHAGMAARYVL